MDKKKITISDVAEALGVSKTTVSRAISGKGRIGEDTRARVMNYIEEHDYKPSIIAKGLANSCTYNIGVVMPEDYCITDAAFFVNCLAGLHEVAAASGYDILLTVCDNVDMLNLERMVDNGKVDGIVLMRTYVEDRSIQFLKTKDVPFAVVGSSEYEDVVQIDQDNEEACRELTSILLMKQFRNIAVVGGSMNEAVTRKRLRGYTSAHEMLKLPVREELVYTDRVSPEEIRNAVDDIVKKKVDCIVCMDDNICVGVLNHLKKIGITVPGQMKIASFFNSTLLENNAPPITALSFDVKRLGAEAGKTLLDMVEKREFEYVTLLGYEVILKESTK